MVTELKPKLTLEERAEILKEHGIKVFHYYDHDCNHSRPTIHFTGDDDEGERAVRVMQGCGAKVGILHRDWVYLGNDDPDGMAWSIEFIPDRIRAYPSTCR